MTRTTKKSALFAMLLGSALFYAQAASATRVYATIDGITLGQLKGDVVRKGLEGKTEVLSYEYSLKAPTVASTARATKREHGSVRITKVMGPASPQLFQALINNELLKSVVIDFVNVSTTTGQEFLASQVRLSNARVVSIDQVTEGGESTATSAKHAVTEGARILEVIAFSFDKIEITSHEGKTSATDSMSAPSP